MHRPDRMDDIAALIASAEDGPSRRLTLDLELLLNRHDRCCTGLGALRALLLATEGVITALSPAGSALEMQLRSGMARLIQHGTLVGGTVEAGADV